MDPLSVTKMLSDEYTVKILTATFKMPRSANYLSVKFNIPIAACYRRIRELEKMRLIHISEKILTPRGKRVSLYQSNLKSAHLTFENGKLKALLELSGHQDGEEVAIWNAIQN
ncbi:transcriptional regulator [Thermoplasmatales archaeon ex4484_6]|nr:MAG: transcriptional regulator [Thermoplasmatales archaeon ex4484_6]RLF68722.1 MAG: ArsR family transcriptional regulator [Thermoplasmata archaeon]